MTIAQEVLAALQEAGTAVGAGPMVLPFSRATAQTPWQAGGIEAFTLTGIDQGIRQVYVSGSTATRQARMLMVDATGTPPAVGDKVTISGKVHDVLAVLSFSPAGVALYHEVEIST